MESAATFGLRERHPSPTSASSAADVMIFRALCSPMILFSHASDQRGSLVFGAFRLLTGFGVDDCKQEVKSEPKLGHDICEADQPYLKVQADAAETLRSEDPKDGIDAPRDKSDHDKDLDSLDKGTVVVLDLGQEPKQLNEDQGKKNHSNYPPIPLVRIE
mmetsp:Transcript_11969/g.25710  ORF Transcript_11969/g.25710 Transcript_11969/m.25710 type:complete len:160 (+) Transcript_11969:340-819(+)